MQLSIDSSTSIINILFCFAEERAIFLYLLACHKYDSKWYFVENNQFYLFLAFGPNVVFTIALQE